MLLDVAAGRARPVSRPLSGYRLELAVRHGLVGLMATGSDPLLSQGALPIFARLQARQQVMERNLRRILTSLAAAGVPATVLKGPHLAQSFYANPAHRTYTDLDILVPPRHLDAALDVLRADPSISSIPPKTPKADKRNIPVADESGVRFTVDLHWDLFSYSQLRGCAGGAVEWGWREARFDPDHPLGPLWELPIEALLAFLTTHAILDHRFRLILFRDLVEVARRDVDWETFVRFVQRWQLRSTAYLALLIAVKAVDAPVEAGVLSRLRPDYFQLRWVERLLARTDLATFDGHRVRPLNLGVVLTHDDPRARLRLAAEAPVAFPRWQRRTEHENPSHATYRNVLLLVASDRRRGAEVNGERLADGLAKKGWDVDFVALFEGDADPRVHAEPLSGPEPYRRLSLHVVAELRRRIVERRPAVLFANGGATLRYAVAAVSTLRKRPKIVYGSIGQPSYWLRSERHVVMQRFLHRRADLILAVSEPTRDELIDIIGYEPERIEVVYVGVPDGFLTDHPRREDGTLRLLYMGAFSPEKDPLAALDLVDRLPNTELRFLGAGPETPRVVRAVERRHLADRVEVVGSVSDVLPHLAWADLLILTSLTEGFPGVVLEAAAAGVPAVGYDVGGVSEAVLHGETGVIVPAGDVDGFTLALQELAGDRSRLYEMAERARARVANEFRMDQVVDRHDAAFRRVLGETGT
jgi:glycosyltransferase involved in cell wall biosynthesis